MSTTELVSAAPNEGSTGDDVTVLFRAKILHLLEVFHFLSPSMIHMGLGTANPAIVWRPILDAMEAEGTIKRTDFQAKTPLARIQSYTIYHLPQNLYIMPSCAQDLNPQTTTTSTS